MSGEYGGDFITLTDEDGKEIELEHLDTLEHNGVTYMAFGINESEEEVAVVITQSVIVDGEEMLEEVQDEAVLDEVYALFMERIEEDCEEDGEE